MSSMILRAPLEFARALFLYAAAFGAMLLGVPFVLARNPLFVIPTALLIFGKVFGGLDWSWWAVTSPTWGMLALWGSHQMQGQARRERARSKSAGAQGVFRRTATGLEDTALYIGSADACERYVERQADPEEYVIRDVE